MTNTNPPATRTIDRLRYGVEGAQQRAATQENTDDKARIPSVRISGHYDDHDIPFVRLTRTVQTGFGIGIGIWLAMLAVAIPTMLVLGALGFGL